MKAIIFLPGRICNGTSFFLYPSDRAFHFPEDLFCRVAAGCAQHGDRLHRVEVAEMGEFTGINIVPGIITAAGQDHKCHAAAHGLLQPHGCALLVQLLQKAPSFDLAEDLSIVQAPYFGQIHRDLAQSLRKIAVFFHAAEPIFQGLHYLGFPLRWEGPKGDLPACPAIGVGHIKDIPEPVVLLAVHQQRDASGALVHPTAQAIPGADLRAGRGSGLLRVNEELFLKGIFIIVGGCGEKVHILPRSRRDPSGFPGCQLCNVFGSRSAHRASPRSLCLGRRRFP